MPYTLMKALLWLVLAALIGVGVGWLLRSVVANRQISRARSQRSDQAEIDRLRGRVANLESVVEERDRLVVELQECRDHASPATPAPAAGVQGFVDTAAAQPEPETDTTSEPSAARGDTADTAPNGTANEGDAGASSAATVPVSVPTTPDVAAAASVLGRAIKLDDLKVIEGIGPKIEDLCHGIGIRTWFDLATTEVSLLSTMLTDAGARYKVHDPTTWPRQAEMLANGRWEEFVAYTDELSGGKAES